MLETQKFDQEVLSLDVGPNTYAKKYKGFITNGFRFLTKRREELRKTQNSGIMVEGEDQNYYGQLTDIIELEYFLDRKVVLFRCDWVDMRPLRGIKKDKYGFPLVNFSRPFVHTGESLKDDPFIIASQARQVFYIEDPKDVGWWHIIMTKPRDTYDMGRNVNMDEDDDDEELYTECIPYNLPILDDVNETPSWRRTDIEIENE